MEHHTEAQHSFSESELQALLDKAAEHGARKALHDICLYDENAAVDVRELRNLLDTWREAKSEAWKTFVGWTVKGLLVCLIAGVYLKTGAVPK